jgi:hypothetical protein
VRKLLGEIGRVWRLLNGPCHDMSALISKSLDQKLPFWERFAYKLHLLYCRACRRYVQQIRWLRTALRKTKDDIEGAVEKLPPDALTPQARARILNRLRKTSQ